MWTARLSGLHRKRGENDFREPYERDRTRVIHSAAFRRLQQKTQIYGGQVGHFHRTRMTHSLEVASIGMSLVRHLRHFQKETIVLDSLPHDDLIYVVCLLHDMGHPPFGHGGEDALNALMDIYGGFESNAQTLRLVSCIETAYEPYGLDLTRRTLLGILKYPIPRPATKRSMDNPLYTEPNRDEWRPVKSYYAFDRPLVEWIFEPFSVNDKTLLEKNVSQNAYYHSLDCSLMDIADDIAYGVHDLEDAIHLRLILRHHFEQSNFLEIMSEIKEFDVNRLLSHLFSPKTAERKQAIGALVHYFVTAVDIKEVQDFEAPLLRYQAKMKPQAKQLLQFLIDAVFQYVIDSTPARAQEYGAQNVLINLFEALLANPHRLMDSTHRGKMHELKKEGDLERMVCDFIANLTDDSAIRLHSKLFPQQFTAQWDNSFLS